jgi:hypothetical protein
MSLPLAHCQILQFLQQFRFAFFFLTENDVTPLFEVLSKTTEWLPKFEVADMTIIQSPIYL